MDDEARRRMLAAQVFEYMQRLQYERCIQDPDLMVALLAFAWIHKEEFEQMLDTAEGME